MAQNGDVTLEQMLTAINAQNAVLAEIAAGGGSDPTTTLKHARATKTFTGGAGNGAVDENIPLFDITGRVRLVSLSLYCQSAIGRSGTPVLYVLNEDANIIFTEVAALAMTAASAGTWADFTAGGFNPSHGYPPTLGGTPASALAGLDVFLAKALVLFPSGGALTSGTMIADVWYYPVSDDGELAAA